MLLTTINYLFELKCPAPLLTGIDDYNDAIYPEFLTDPVVFLVQELRFWPVYQPSCCCQAADKRQKSFWLIRPLAAVKQRAQGKVFSGPEECVKLHI